MNGKDTATEVVAEKEKQEAPQDERKVRSRITVTLFADGNVQADGPLHDPILYQGMLAIAADIGRDYVRRATLQAQRAAEAQKKKPFFVRKMEEARAKKAAEGTPE